MWDERYQAPGFAYGTAANDFLVEQEARFPAGARILSLAEGEGRNAVWLAERGHDVVGVDSSAVGLEKAQTLAKTRGVTIDTIHADLAAFPIDEGAWDVIVSIWAHVPPAIRGPLHARCAAALKPGGVLVLEAYAPAQTKRTTGGPKDPTMCMSLQTLREELPALEFETAVEKVRMVHEGPFHDGESDVVQLVARRPR